MKCGHLRNGWKYIIHPNPCLKTATILVLFATGSIDETDSEKGLAHFIEHLFFHNDSLTQSIYKLGGYINAFTSYNYTGYYIKIDAAYLENALKIFSKMFFQCKFTTAAIEKEKGIVIQENKKHESEPNRLLNDLSNGMVYQGTPLANNIGGYEKQIRGFSRPMILKYLSKNYGRAVVSLVGTPANSRTLSKLNKYLGKAWLASTKSSPSPSSSIKSRICDQIAPAIKLMPAAFEEVYLSVTFPVADMYQEKEILMTDIIGIVLAGNMNSRLFLKLREKKQYIYSIKCYSNHYQIGGDISIQCGTQSKYIKAVIAGILDELDGGLKITSRELKDAINYRIGQMRLVNAEDSAEVAFYQAYQYVYMDKCREITDEISLYREITLKEINAYAKDIFDMKKLNIAIIANSK